MRIRLLGVVVTATVIAAAHGSATAYEIQIPIAAKVADRIEYDGIAMGFCQAVGGFAYSAKGTKEPVTKVQDSILDGIEKNKALQPRQRAVAKRIATVLTARVYAEVPYQKNDPELKKVVAQLSEVECINANSLLQGLTALDTLTAKK